MDREWNFKGKKLYNDGRIQIYVSESFPDEHDVVIGNNHVFLARGILNEWASADVERIASGYRALRSFAYEEENPDIPIEEFGWALAKARIADLDEWVSDLLTKVRTEDL